MGFLSVLLAVPGCSRSIPRHPALTQHADQNMIAVLQSVSALQLISCKRPLVRPLHALQHSSIQLSNPAKQQTADSRAPCMVLSAWEAGHVILDHGVKTRETGGYRKITSFLSFLENQPLHSHRFLNQLHPNTMSSQTHRAPWSKNHFRDRQSGCTCQDGRSPSPHHGTFPTCGRSECGCRDGEQ